MPGICFKEALENAELLVAFTSENGLNPDPKLIRGVTHARALAEAGAGAVTEEEEATFFEIYAALASAVGKGTVTVASIRDSSVQYGDKVRRWWFGPHMKISKAQHAVYTYREWTIVALIILLLIQSYWIFGASLLDRLTRLEKQASELDVKRKDLEGQALLANGDMARQQLQHEIDPIGAEKNNNDTLQTDTVTLLKKWRGMRGIGRFFGANLSAPTDEFLTKEETTVQSENWLRTIQTYVLTLLYGWIGACAYVLRQLIAETRDRTYRDEERIGYGLRMTLGTLSGLAVGWFLSPDATTVTGTQGHLAPLALSFAAGYSVEVLFSALDKIASSFNTASASAK